MSHEELPFDGVTMCFGGNEYGVHGVRHGGQPRVVAGEAQGRPGASGRGKTGTGACFFASHHDGDRWDCAATNFPRMSVMMGEVQPLKTEVVVVNATPEMRGTMDTQLETSATQMDASGQAAVARAPTSTGTSARRRRGPR